MRRSLPPSSAPYAFGFLLSAFMSLLVSGIATVRTIGLTPGLLQSWMLSWLSSWIVAFPVVLVVAPIVRKIVSYLVAPPSSTG
ncbi:MAG: DUF2798 domain-containing protein [Hyphomicrobiaceae bacterium]